MRDALPSELSQALGRRAGRIRSRRRTARAARWACAVNAAVLSFAMLDAADLLGHAERVVCAAVCMAIFCAMCWRVARVRRHGHRVIAQSVETSGVVALGYDLIPLADSGDPIEAVRARDAITRAEAVLRFAPPPARPKLWATTLLASVSTTSVVLVASLLAPGSIAAPWARLGTPAAPPWSPVALAWMDGELVATDRAPRLGLTWIGDVIVRTATDDGRNATQHRRLDDNGRVRLDLPSTPGTVDAAVTLVGTGPISRALARTLDVSRAPTLRIEGAPSSRASARGESNAEAPGTRARGRGGRGAGERGREVRAAERTPEQADQVLRRAAPLRTTPVPRSQHAQSSELDRIPRAYRALVQRYLEHLAEGAREEPSP